MNRNPSNFAELVNLLIELISLAVPFIFGLTLLVIIWKVIDAWIINSGDEGKVAEGKQTLLVGVLVLVVMSGLWGILELFQNSFFGS